MSVFDSIKIVVPDPCHYSFLRQLPDDIREEFIRTNADSGWVRYLMINSETFAMKDDRRNLLVKTILRYNEPL